MSSQRVMRQWFFIGFLLYVSWLPFERLVALNEADSEFKEPGKTFRLGRNIHSVPATEAEQNQLLDGLIDSGYGRISTNVNWTQDYMNNDAELAKLFDFVRRARSKGLDVWLYDENTYPSGMAGDLLLNEHPEWEAEGLFFRQISAEGPSEVVVQNELQTLLCLFAVPVMNGIPVLEQRVDLADRMQDGKLIWNAPEGKWLVCLIGQNVLHEGFQAGTVRGPKAWRYTSLLMPEVANRFIEVTHKKYAQALGEPLGTLFSCTFTDEPSLMAQRYGQSNYGVYPWKENVSEEYAKRTGRKLLDDLPTIMLDAGAFGQQCRSDYFRLIADFVSLNFFKAIRDYDASQGVLSSGHLLVEESLMAQVPLYGDIMACYRQMDVPGIDVLTGRPSITRHYLYSSRLASSATELQGRSDVMCETCPVDPQGEEPPALEVRGVVNREILGGVTRFSDYLQLSHEDAAGRDQFNTYVARSVSQLSGGVRAARVAVYYPIESVWSHFRPFPTWLDSWYDVSGGDPEAQRISILFKNVSDALYDSQTEFSYLDTRGIIESVVENGRLIYDRLGWDILILPSVETIPDEAMNRLVEFVQSGGKVLIYERFPTNSTDRFPSETFARQTEQWRQSETHVVFHEEFNAESLRKYLRSNLKPEIEFSSPSGFLCSHRKMIGYDVFFIVNDTPEPKEVTLTLTGSVIEQRIPRTGDIISVAVDGNQKGTFTVLFEPFEGIVVKRIP